MEFAREHLPETQFFLAEKAFKTLLQEGHKKNILDIENLISKFSDYILIVLESHSSFSELGAFSHMDLRDKLIIINDEKFKNAQSFINLGPLKAIVEATNKDRILHYDMQSDGIYKLDGIGAIYAQLHGILKGKTKPKKTRLHIDQCDPSKHCDKNSAHFLHDLIYFSGPCSHAEIVELMKIIFGKDKSYNYVRTLLAILSSFDSIEINAVRLYRSKLTQTYFEYDFDSGLLISTFRNYMQKTYPERIYEYCR